MTPPILETLSAWLANLSTLPPRDPNEDDDADEQEEDEDEEEEEPPVVREPDED
jgi:hypothetical protein